MILRRFMKHVNDQNWFAVGLDVIVVIVGIFLGLQVQAWYDGIDAEQEEQRVLGYLISDMEQNIDYLEGRISAAENKLILARRLIEILENGVLPEDEIEVFEESIVTFSRIELPTPFLNSFYEENLNIIIDGDVRKAIDDYRGTTNRIQNVVQDLIERVNSLEDVIDLRTPVESGIGSERIVHYDFEQLKHDREYRAAAISIVGRVASSSTSYKYMLDQSTSMLQLLKEYRSGQDMETIDFQNAN